MNKNYLSILTILSLILAILLIGCTSKTPDAQPIEVISVSGPLEPINPGGPIVEITLKNISNESVMSLNATLEIPNKSFIFNFNIDSTNPLPPNQSISTKLTLIGAGFDDKILYPLIIEGTLQSGTKFNYTKQVQITVP